jgi:photosystem II stability/assembly factor-like uncharacterized protein
MASQDHTPTKTSRRALNAVVTVLPWAIIAGLLWAGVFIKPQPVGATVTPALLERRDHFYGLALAGGEIWAVGSNGKILAFAKDKVTRRLAVPTEETLQDVAVWDAQHAVAVGNGGVVVYSADGGEHWSAAADVPRSQVANKLCRVRVGEGGAAIAVGEMGALLLSQDYAKSWRRIRAEEDSAWNDVAILPDGHVVVVGEFGRVLIGDMQGAQWEEVKTSVQGSLMSVRFRDDLNGVVVGLDGALLVTSDGGRQWRAVDSGTRDHLFDVAWVPERQHWFAVGALGRWVESNGDGWGTGTLGERNLSWHTRALPVDGNLQLAGADIGRWDGRQWLPLQ